jgi:hypothetical protein
MLSPHQRAIHQYAAELLQGKYEGNQNILSRVSHYIVTEQDVKEFAKLLLELYQAGFMRASEQYRTSLEKMGYAVTIKKKE